jgi:integral membrane sensor domain MASE1
MISLSYISHGFALYPFVSFAGFAALIGVGAWHFTWGWAKWLGLSPTQVNETESKRHLVKKRRWYGINAVAALVTALWLAGGLGMVGRGGKTGGWVGREYDELYNSMPLIGRWR